MTASTLPELSRSELDVMKVLWQQGRSNVREVHEELSRRYDWAYSTTKTTMDRMVRKGLLERQEFHGVFLYRPLISRPLGLARLVQEFADRVLELNAAAVVPLFAEGGNLTTQELAELEQLLEAHEAQAPDAGQGGDDADPEHLR